jgi:transposase
MNSVADSSDVIHLGLDVHKGSISAGILPGDRNVADVTRVGGDVDAVRRLIDRFPDRSALRTCYEAGPTGFGLARMLRSWGVSCEVIAPSLIPTAAGDRVKTDRRDARRLARLHRGGQLTAIRVPTEAEEAVRDLCRARADAVDDRTRAQKRLAAFLLRRGKIYRGGSAWTCRHEQWMASLNFTEAADQTTFGRYRSVLSARQAELTAIEADLLAWADREPFADPVRRLAGYRGIATLGALTLVGEVGDWHRFAHAQQFMAFTGLVPTEYSSGSSVRRGHLTKTGNVHVRTQLIESVWAYNNRHPNVGPALRKRQQGLPADTLARSWVAQQRLCRRFRLLLARKGNPSVVAAAVARELAGFLWAEMSAT